MIMIDTKIYSILTCEKNYAQTTYCKTINNRILNEKYLFIIFETSEHITVRMAMAYKDAYFLNIIFLFNLKTTFLPTILLGSSVSGKKLCLGGALGDGFRLIFFGFFLIFRSFYANTNFVISFYRRQVRIDVKLRLKNLNDCNLFRRCEFIRFSIKICHTFNQTPFKIVFFFFVTKKLSLHTDMND